MIHGESRFFINWQMPKEVSKILIKPIKLDDENPNKNDVIRMWLDHTGIYDRIQYKPESEADQQALKDIIQQYTQNNYQFCIKNKFTE